MRGEGSGPGPALGLALPADFEMDVFGVVAGLRPLGKLEEVPDEDLDATCRSVERLGLHTRAVAGPGRGSSVVYFARHHADLEEIFGLERTQRLKRSAGRRARASRHLGLRLGYPECCVQAFVAASRQSDEELYGARSAALTNPAPARMNYFVRSVAPVGHLPCTVDCGPSLSAADEVLEALERAHGVSPDALADALRGVVLWWRGPHFLLFRGVEAPSEEGFRFSEVLVAPDIVRLPPLRHHVEAARRLRHLAEAIGRGERARVRGDGLVVYAGDDVVYELEEPGVAARLAAFTA